jgi:hypothetical protein
MARAGTVTSASASDVLMAEPANGSGSAVPLSLFPPGFNMSAFNILDPATGEWVSGNGYSISAAPEAQPMDGGASPMDSTNDINGTTTGFFRVFHIPDWLVSFDGYQFDGPTFIPVDFSEPDAPTNLVESITVLINGQPTDDFTYLTQQVIDGTAYAGVGIYFDRFPNGTNTIQLLTTVRQSNVLNADTPYMVFSNAPQTIVFNNFVTYTNWSSLILSNTYTFNAQSTTTNVDWEIDIYDQNGDFVNSETNYSASGTIAWTWDLTDYTGADRSDGDNDPFFYPYITITPASGGTDPGGYMPAVAAQFPSSGSWLFSWMDKFYDDGSTNYGGADSYYTNAINTMQGGPIEWGIGTWDAPIKYGRTYAETNREASWVNLQNFLQFWPIRNFYYFGHGAPNSVGGDINTVDTNDMITGGITLPGSTSKLTSQWVHDNVTFNQLRGGQPYRFVWLDGCNTAATNGNWPWAFGIPNQAEYLGYYQSSANTTGARPNAFAGWDVEVGGPGWGTIPNFWQFRSLWMADWAGTTGKQLNDAFSDANDFSSWISAGQFAHLKQFGFTSMTFFQYNHDADWP